MDKQIWLNGFFAAIVLFQIVAIPALILKKNDLADVLWGPAFPLSAFLALWFSNKNFADLDLRSILVLSLITVWAARLFFHVGLRNLSHREEDVRYNNWRKQWGTTWLWRSYLQVFVLQAFILYVFLTPVLLTLSSNPQTMSAMAWIGFIVWVIGFLFESISDEQLRKFKSKPESKGVLMTAGLWSWSRHPNYFGEVTQWWGIWLMVVELPNSWFTIISPIGVTFLILKVSGISMLEALMEKRAGFADYKKRTSIFFPLPPKK